MCPHDRDGWCIDCHPTGVYLASTFCEGCQQRVLADADMLENDEGLLVSTVFRCRACDAVFSVLYD